MPCEYPPNFQKFLPSKMLSVTAFIAFAFPSNSVPCPLKFMHVEKIYSELPPTTKDASQVAENGPINNTPSFGDIMKMTQMVRIFKVFIY